jgi:hypothetical protein
VHDISSRAVDAKAFVSAQLSEMESALDGFPAAVLLDDCLTVEDGVDAVDRGAQGLFEHILTRWATTIERDLERFPPATIDVPQDIRRRMVDARDALLRVRSLLQDLSNLAPSSVKPDERSGSPRTVHVTGPGLSEAGNDAGRPVSASCDTLRQFERDVWLQGSARTATSPAHWPAIAASRRPARRKESARP